VTAAFAGVGSLRRNRFLGCTSVGSDTAPPIAVIISLTCTEDLADFNGARLTGIYLHATACFFIDI
jgi:hypothetical protein